MTPPSRTEAKQKPEATPREPKLSDRAYETMLALIMDGSIPVGGKLPTEHALSDRLGISRPVVRQALQKLREDKVIVSRQGSGSFVSRRPDGSFRTFAAVGSILDIQRTFEFRAAIEGEAASLAAQRRSIRDLDRMDRSYEELDRCVGTGDLGVDADEALHAAICAATANDYFGKTREMMKANILAGMNVTRNLSLLQPQGRLALVQQEHSRILDAIRAQSPDDARAAMRAHIENARQRMFGDVPPP